MRSELLLLGSLGALGACGGTSQGTVVGNPGLDVLRLASGTEVRTETASVPVDAVEFVGCASGSDRVTVQDVLDLVEGEGFDAPDGTYCEVRVAFDGVLSVAGTSTGSGASRPVRLDLELTSAALAADEPFVVDDTPLVVELAFPGWFSVDELVDGDDGYQVGPADPAHDGLVQRVQLGSALFADTNDNGVLDADEREAGELARGAARPPRR